MGERTAEQTTNLLLSLFKKEKESSQHFSLEQQFSNCK